jgi:TrmH family RNA methyltransferase
MRQVAITSSHNPRFRAASSLRGARERRERGLILIDGVREVARAIESGVKVVEAWVAIDRLDGAAAEDVLERLRSTAVEVIEAPPELLDRLAFGDRNEGVVVVAQPPSVNLDALELPDQPLVAVIEGVEKPGNLGAILRSADGAGVNAVVAADPATDPWNPNAIRASLGAAFSVPIAVATAAETFDWLRRQGVRVVAALVDAPVAYTDTDLTGALAIVLGSEAAGLSEMWRAADVTAVQVPMLGVGDSLNVSATAAILFYEALRQRAMSVTPRRRART